MKTLLIPNFSLPFVPDGAVEALSGTELHYLQGDVDHGRVVAAFSVADAVASAASGGVSDPARVGGALLRLLDVFLPHIDLRDHDGVHPRIGALDVCPVVGGTEETVAFIRRGLEERGIPVALYEKSGNATLPQLRRRPDPSRVGHASANGGGHARWGTTVLGRRDFLIAANIDLADPDPALAHRLAKEIRARREAGEPTFRGVRALGFPLASRGLSQLSFNLTRPDETAFDDLYAWTVERAEIAGTELIGVIRPADGPKSTRLTVDPAQVVSVD